MSHTCNSGNCFLHGKGVAYGERYILLEAKTGLTAAPCRPFGPGDPAGDGVAGGESPRPGLGPGDVRPWVVGDGVPNPGVLVRGVAARLAAAAGADGPGPLPDRSGLAVV